MDKNDANELVKAFAGRVVEALSKYGPFVAYSIEYAEGRFDDIDGLHTIAKRQGLDLMRIARIMLSPESPLAGLEDKEIIEQTARLAVELASSYAVMLTASSRQEVNELPLMPVQQAKSLVPDYVVQWLEEKSGLKLEFIGA